MCNRHDHIAAVILLGDGGFDMQMEIGASSTNIASEWPASCEPENCGVTDMIMRKMSSISFAILLNGLVQMRYNFVRFYLFDFIVALQVQEAK